MVPTATNNYPNSFVNSSGQPDGFAVELLDAVARIMGLRLQRVMEESGDNLVALAAGRVDIFQTYAYTPEREEQVAFSASYLELAGGLFVNKQAPPIRQIEELNGRRILVVGSGGIGDHFVRERVPQARIVRAVTGEQALRRLDAGEADALFISRLSGVSAVDHDGLHNVVPFGTPISGYEVRLCFAVRKDNALLLARLNEGLAILHRTGEYDRIYRKWFGRFEPMRFTREQVVAYVAAALAIALIVALWANHRGRQLRRRIARQAEELAENQAILAEAQAFAHIGHWKLERATGQVSWSEETFRIFERDPATGAPPDADELIRYATPDDQQRWREGLARLRETGDPLMAELELLLPSGHRKYLQTRTRPVRDAIGRVIGTFGTVQDITERRQHDEEIAQGRRLRALGELVGGIAHEFNNLLTPILFNSDVLRKEFAEHPRLSGELRLIADAANRSAELTRRLLTFSRKTEVQAQSFTLATVVENNLALLRHTIDRRIVIENQLGPDLPPLYLNLGDLQQVLLNLLVNARDTLSDRLQQSSGGRWVPRIIVAARRVPRPVALPTHAPATDAWLCVTVQDNGMGMTQSVMERIFEPFYTTKETGKGTGLGLATVWHLMNEIGGRVMVASEPGVGSTFTIYLPVVTPPSAVPVQPRPSSASPLPPGTPRRILVVEDEESISRLLQKLLQRFGHTVTHFPNGSDAWQRLAAGPKDFNLLLLDLNTPGLTGVELAERARLLPFKGPIIVMSGRVSDEERAALERVKVDAIIAKPFTIGTFTSALAELGIATAPLAPGA